MVLEQGIADGRAAGGVVDDGEYREQLEFTQVLQGLIAGMPAKPEKGGAGAGRR